MKITIVTLFPQMFTPVLNMSILGRAQKKGKVEFELINLRDFGEGVHKIVDDKPYGGGAGMILKADVLTKALQWTIDNGQLTKNKMSNPIKSDSNVKCQMSNVILTSASGIPYKQKKALELSKLDHIILICGHYEGVDQRFIDKYIDEEISIGNYVLTGGEIPAMVIADSIVRLIPGVLEKPEATQNESFSNYTLTPKPYTLLEHPHYTRPEVFEGEKVPSVLLSGNHAEIKKWRLEKSIEKTKIIEKDLDSR